MDSYTPRQIEVSNLLQGVPSEVANEIITTVGEAEKRSANVISEKDSENTESLIRLKLLDETDWRRRASLCALLISRSLV